MARSWESNCVGCETCINCGARQKFPVFECDICGNYDYEESFIVENIDGKDYCECCYNDYLEENEEEE